MEARLGALETFPTTKGERVFPPLAPSQEMPPRANPAVQGDTPAPLRKLRMPKRPGQAVPEPQEGHVHTTILSFSNLHQSGELFVNYLRARKQVFIDQKGWNLPQEDGMEFDQYDTAKARWVVLHEYGEVLAGVRIAPTTAQCGQHSYMIRDAQKGVLDDLPFDVLYFEAPVSDEIWEATRLFVCPSVPAERRMRINALLLQGMAQAAREVGATHVLGIVPAIFRRWMGRLGMTATPVGPALSIDGDKVQAALMNVVLDGSGRASA